jgi:hypothetical protein
MTDGLGFVAGSAEGTAREGMGGAGDGLQRALVPRARFSRT